MRGHLAAGSRLHSAECLGVGEGEGVNRDEIAQMMQDTAGANWGTEAHFQRFAALVAAHEREACEKLVWNTPELDDEYVSHREAIAAAIRARGDA